MSFVRPRRTEAALAAIGALDLLRSRVMIADADLVIRYMNPAATELMREAEADLRRELPAFDVGKLVGSSIDVFHRNPAHQRRMLEVLDKPHRTTIRIGERVFDLRVAPLRGEGGRRTGYVVEWGDARERLLKLDFAAQLQAIDRSQAVIAFRPDGHVIDANANFLHAFGYTIDEIRGRPHGMFVEPECRDSAEDRALWERLRAGHFQAAQFRRFGKDGKEVWIEGTYNPILDENGKVVKIVMFAIEITGQKQLLANLGRIIDQNFGEIEGAVGQSTAEAASAASAVAQTSGKVQSVAASAEQLVASVASVVADMARSRVATEGAFEETNAIGRNAEMLAQAAQAMGGIVGLIKGVASQINLLALNATIEAARAGDAGRGFAVVASEVKSLAVQVAKATEQISAEIDGMQSASAAVISRIGTIRETVVIVRESVSAATTAMDEQASVTRGISAEMQGAASAVETVSSNIGGISSAVGQVAKAMAKTKEAASVLVR